MPSAIDQLDGLTKLMGVIQGAQGKTATGTKTNKGTTTTGSNITDEGVDRIVQQILAGPGGVKDIGGRARGSGLYNSTTELQNLNDLTARVAGETAKQRAGTTTTTDQTITETAQTSGMDLGSLIKPIALMSAASPILGGVKSMLKGKGFMEGTGLGELFGSGTSTGAAPVAAGIPSLAGVTAGPSLAGSMGTTLGNSLGTTLGSDALGGITQSLVGDLSNMVTAPTVDLGATLGTSLADFAPSAGGSFALNSIPGAGSFLGGLIGGNAPEDMSGFGLGSSALAGAASMGPVGLLAAPFMAVLGSAFGDMSIVCTALVGRGLLNKVEYSKGQAYLRTLHPYTKQGYYHLFTNIANKIAAGDDKWTRICLPWAESRMHLLSSTGWRRWIRFPLGTITRVIGQPLCWAIGAVLALKANKKERAWLI
jgi:hypothetical protein